LGFLGQHEHTLVAKNRLTIPHRFRAALSDGVILARSLDPCVSIYTPKGWDSFTGQWVSSRDPLNSEARRIQRYFYSGSFDTQLDAAGRIMVPPALIEYAGLAKEVVVVGCGDWLEVWDRDRLRAHEQQSGESIAESAQRLAAEAPLKR
jgi:MraZ protein